MPARSNDPLLADATCLRSDSVGWSAQNIGCDGGVHRNGHIVVAYLNHDEALIGLPTRNRFDFGVGQFRHFDGVHVRHKRIVLPIAPCAGRRAGSTNTMLAGLRSLGGQEVWIVLIQPKWPLAMRSFQTNRKG